MKKLTGILGLPAVFALAFGASTIASAQPAQGQQPAGQPQQQQQQQPTMELDEQTKRNFIGAYSDIMEIQMKYSEKLQNVTDETEAMSLQQEAQGEMQEAVEDNNMTVEEYNQVIQVASSDPELLAELEAAIAEQQEQ